MLGKLVNAVPEERQVRGHLYLFPSNFGQCFLVRVGGGGWTGVFGLVVFVFFSSSS